MHAVILFQQMKHQNIVQKVFENSFYFVHILYICMYIYIVFDIFLFVKKTQYNQSFSKQKKSKD